jgi:hypothetical protein
MEMKPWIKKNKNANGIPGKETKFLKVSVIRPYKIENC